MTLCRNGPDVLHRLARFLFGLLMVGFPYLKA
jgi:hypothetical protein